MQNMLTIRWPLRKGVIDKGADFSRLYERIVREALWGVISERASQVYRVGSFRIKPPHLVFRAECPPTLSREELLHPVIELAEAICTWLGRLSGAPLDTSQMCEVSLDGELIYSFSAAKQRDEPGTLG